MLKKGEIAKSIEAKHSRNRSSVRAIYSLLSDTASNSLRIDPIVLEACESQSNLAALEIASKGIHRISLNTLKSVAESVIEDGGWRRIDELRIRIRNTVRKKRIERGLTPLQKKELEVRELKSRLDKAQRTRAILNRAYFDAISLLRGVAAVDATTFGKLQRHEATFGEELGLRAVGRTS